MGYYPFQHFCKERRSLYISNVPPLHKGNRPKSHYTSQSVPTIIRATWKQFHESKKIKNYSAWLKVYWKSAGLFLLERNVSFLNRCLECIILENSFLKQFQNSSWDRRFWSHSTWAWIIDSSCTNCFTLDKLYNLSVSTGKIIEPIS